MSPGYDRAAADYDARFADPVSRARSAILDAPLLAAARGRRRVLELGSGTNRLLAALASVCAHPVGIEPSAEMLRHRTAPALPVVRGDAAALPFADRSFDAVIASRGVWRYLDPAASWRETARVLRPGGVLAIHQYPQRVWRPVGRGGAAAVHAGIHEVASTRALLAEATAAGFTALEVRRWRSIRFAPYLMSIPAWLDARSPLPLWSHLVVVLRSA